MSGIVAALSLFGAIALIVAAVRAEPQDPALDDRPKRLPLPGARDLHNTAAGTMFRARVPRWG